MAYDISGLFERVQAALFAHPRLPLTALATELRVERHTVERAVRETTGVPFRALRDKALMDLSSNLLRARPSLTVKEVALRLGYTSPRAFARAFKRVSGMSPTAFRAVAGHAQRSRLY